MKLFAHSTKDIYLIILALFEVALLVYSSVSYGHLPSSMTLGCGAVLVFLICTNFQCTAHNFLHNPFFISNRLNHVFSIINTLGIGVPQSLYRVHHLHHHKYNNDAKDPVTGTTKDRTSTYRYARKPGQEEHIISYAFLGFFRSSFSFMLQEANKRGLIGLVVVETCALGFFVVLLFVLNWKGVLYFFLPVWYLGQCAAQAENYLEHHGAIPGNRLTDSVSCYNTFYNAIWFNNGYHQEHHYRPQVHWTMIPAVQSLMHPASERRIVCGTHWFNFNPPPRHMYVRHTTSHGQTTGSAQFLAVCRRSKWSKYVTNAPRLALLAMAGSRAACKISSACSHALRYRKFRRN